MSKLIRSSFSPRSLSLVLTLALLATTLALVIFPIEAWALWAEKTTYKYYSDATYTVKVGQCVENGCTGAITCSGQQTEFETTSTVPISCPGF